MSRKPNIFVVVRQTPTQHVLAKISSCLSDLLQPTISATPDTFSTVIVVTE